MTSETERDDLRAARRRHTRFLIATAAIAVVVLVVSHAVLLPFVLALVIAYVLTPLVAWVERRSAPRAAAIVLVYVVVLGSLLLFARLAAPRVGLELAALRRELPTLARTIRSEWVPAIQAKLRSSGFGSSAPDGRPRAELPAAEVPASVEPSGALVARPRPDGSLVIEIHGGFELRPTKEGGFTLEEARDARDEAFDLDRVVSEAAGKSLQYAQHNALELVKLGREIVAAVSRVIFVFGITLMLAAYMMLTRERILAFFASLVRPADRPSFHELLARIDRGLAGVVRGQLIICLVNGVLSAIGFAMVDLKYWPVLALVATVFSLIPIFGSIVSSVPAVALGLTQSFGTAAFVLAWIVGIHQLEANLLNPKIMGDQAKIHPVLVIFSLLVGEHFFHTTGALLAVPCMSIAQSLFVHVRRAVQARDPEMFSEPVGSLLPPPPR